MPEAAVSPELLHDVIERRVFADASSFEGQLASLAWDCRAIRVAGPSAAVEERLRARITRFPVAERRALAWWQGWLGPDRPLTQRLAALALTVGLAGGGTSAATGVSPAEFASDTATLMHSIVVNLNPAREEGSPQSGEAAAVSPTPPATPPPATQVPGVQAETPAAETPVPATPTATKTSDDDHHDDEKDDDHDKSENGHAKKQDKQSFDDPQEDDH